MAMNRLGVLQKVSDAGAKGISSEAISEACGVSQYGVETLLEAGLSLGLVKLVEPYTYRIARMGAFWLKDRQTIANADFIQDVCYKGTFHLDDAIKEEGPAGLKELGDWPNIYHGLSKLPGRSKESWFKFDHHYSDVCSRRDLDSYRGFATLDAKRCKHFSITLEFKSCAGCFFKGYRMGAFYFKNGCIIDVWVIVFVACCILS